MVNRRPLKASNLLLTAMQFHAPPPPTVTTSWEKKLTTAVEV
jgi:hypothetical protein